MLKVNFLSNEGLQKITSSRQVESSTIKKPLQSNLKKYEDIENITNNVDSSMFSKVEDELNQDLSTQQNHLKKRYKSINLNIKKIFFLLTILIFICIITLGGYYIYKKVDLSKFDILTKLSVLFDKNVPSTETNEYIDVISQTNEIADIHLNTILKNKIKFNIGATLLDFIPDKSDIFAFEISDSTISLVFKIKDKNEGENFKKRISNLSHIITPKLVYIEKTIDDKNYQVTTLLDITSKMPDNVSGFKHYEDKFLANLISKLAINANVNIQPIRISKHDPLVVRNAYIICTGLKSNIEFFLQDLYKTHINLSVDNMKIEQSNNNFVLYLNAKIYPQDYNIIK